MHSAAAARGDSGKALKTYGSELINKIFFDDKEKKAKAMHDIMIAIDTAVMEQKVKLG